ncbi:serine/threonine-protein kinase STY17 [Balamuthia mandrillaris]
MKGPFGGGTSFLQQQQPMANNHCNTYHAAEAEGGEEVEQACNNTRKEAADAKKLRKTLLHSVQVIEKRLLQWMKQLDPSEELSEQEERAFLTSSAVVRRIHALRELSELLKGCPLSEKEPSLLFDKDNEDRRKRTGGGRGGADVARRSVIFCRLQSSTTLAMCHILSKLDYIRMEASRASSNEAHLPELARLVKQCGSIVVDCIHQEKSPKPLRREPLPPSTGPPPLAEILKASRPPLASSLPTSAPSSFSPSSPKPPSSTPSATAFSPRSPAPFSYAQQPPQRQPPRNIFPSLSSSPSSNVTSFSPSTSQMYSSTPSDNNNNLDNFANTYYYQNNASPSTSPSPHSPFRSQSHETFFRSAYSPLSLSGERPPRPPRPKRQLASSTSAPALQHQQHQTPPPRPHRETKPPHHHRHPRYQSSSASTSPISSSPPSPFIHSPGSPLPSSNKRGSWLSASPPVSIAPRKSSFTPRSKSSDDEDAPTIATTATTIKTIKSVPPSRPPRSATVHPSVSSSPSAAAASSIYNNRLPSPTLPVHTQHNRRPLPQAPLSFSSPSSSAAVLLDELSSFEAKNNEQTPLIPSIPAFASPLPSSTQLAASSAVPPEPTTPRRKRELGSGTYSRAELTEEDLPILVSELDSTSSTFDKRSLGSLNNSNDSGILISAAPLLPASSQAELEAAKEQEMVDAFRTFNDGRFLNLSYRSLSTASSLTWSLLFSPSSSSSPASNDEKEKRQSQMTKLEGLEMKGNKLTFLPTEMLTCGMSFLQKLNLSRNQLQCLPKRFGSAFPMLEELLLDSNCLQELDESLGELRQLKVLSLKCNALTKLPESIGQLSNLQTLDLLRNNLSGPKALPPSFGLLTSLRRLDLTGNRNLGPLPKNLFHRLTGLQVLRLWQSLHIYSQRGNSLPLLLSLEQRFGSVKFDLKQPNNNSNGNNKNADQQQVGTPTSPRRKRIVNSIVKRFNTKKGQEEGGGSGIVANNTNNNNFNLLINEHHVDNTPIERKMDEEKEKEKEMEDAAKEKERREEEAVVLSEEEDDKKDEKGKEKEGEKAEEQQATMKDQEVVNRNELHALQSTLFQLPALEELDLGGNLFSSLRVGSALVMKPNLRTKVGVIPTIGEAVLSKSLRVLNLSRNKLTYLPTEICLELKALTHLDIYDNHICILPPEIVKLTNLKTLILDKNPIDSPPKSRIEEGLNGVFKYLNSLLPGEFYDSFVLFVLSCCCEFPSMKQMTAKEKQEYLRRVQQWEVICSSWPPRLILRHVSNFLSVTHDKYRVAREKSKTDYRKVEVRLYLLLLKCKDNTILTTALEKLISIIADNGERVVKESGIEALASTMKSNAEAGRQNLEKLAARALVHLCTACSTPDQLYGSTVGGNPMEDLWTIPQVGPHAEVLDMKTPAKICQAGGDLFWRHFLRVARSEPKHFPTLLVLCSKGYVEVHNHVEINDIQLGELLGNGVSARVYAGTWQGQPIAIKKFHEEMVSPREVRTEVAFLTILQCKEVLHCLGACIEPPNMFIITEHFDGGSLFDLLHTQEKRNVLLKRLSFQEKNANRNYNRHFEDERKTRYKNSIRLRKSSDNLSLRHLKVQQAERAEGEGREKEVVLENAVATPIVGLHPSTPRPPPSRHNRDSASSLADFGFSIGGGGGQRATQRTKQQPLSSSGDVPVGSSNKDGRQPQRHVKVLKRGMTFTNGSPDQTHVGGGGKDGGRKQGAGVGTTRPSSSMASSNAAKERQQLLESQEKGRSFSVASKGEIESNNGASSSTSASLFTVDQLFETGPSVPWNMDTTLGMAIDAARGLAYLHSIDVCHRDIKSENLLVRRDMSACIADLGISRVMGPKMTKALGTPRYMAPEVITGKPYGMKADVYSYGILLWEMVTGAIPFVDLVNGWELAGAITHGKRPTISAHWPKEFRELLEACWAADPSARPEFTEITSTLVKLRASLQGLP